MFVMPKRILLGAFGIGILAIWLGSTAYAEGDYWDHQSYGQSAGGTQYDMARIPGTTDQVGIAYIQVDTAAGCSKLRYGVFDWDGIRASTAVCEVNVFSNDISLAYDGDSDHPVIAYTEITPSSVGNPESSYSVHCAWGAYDNGWSWDVDRDLFIQWSDSVGPIIVRGIASGEVQLVFDERSTHSGQAHLVYQFDYMTIDEDTGTNYVTMEIHDRYFTGSAWNPFELIDEGSSANDPPGTYKLVRDVSMASCAEGPPQLAYQSQDLTTGSICYAAWTGSGWSPPSVVWSDSVAAHPFLALDPATGDPGIAFQTAQHLYFMIDDGSGWPPLETILTWSGTGSVRCTGLDMERDGSALLKSVVLQNWSSDEISIMEHGATGWTSVQDGQVSYDGDRYAAIEIMPGLASSPWVLTKIKGNLAVAWYGNQQSNCGGTPVRRGGSVAFGGWKAAIPLLLALGAVAAYAVRKRKGSATASC